MELFIFERPGKVAQITPASANTLVARYLNPTAAEFAGHDELLFGVPKIFCVTVGVDNPIVSLMGVQTKPNAVM